MLSYDAKNIGYFRGAKYFFDSLKRSYVFLCKSEEWVVAEIRSKSLFLFLQHFLENREKILRNSMKKIWYRADTLCTLIVNKYMNYRNFCFELYFALIVTTVGLYLVSIPISDTMPLSWLMARRVPARPTPWGRVLSCRVAPTGAGTNRPTRNRLESSPEPSDNSSPESPNDSPKPKMRGRLHRNSKCLHR